jgi:carboxyl-terminal processing protease
MNSARTNRASHVAAAIIICSATALQAQEQPYPRGPSAIPLLHEVWSFSAERIYPPELSKRFDSRILEELDATLRGSDEVALADVLNPFLTSLGVSHTGFYDRRHQTYYMLRSLFSTRDLDMPQLFTLGIQLKDEDPGMIRAVFEGSPAESVGIRSGDRIVAVDGAPFVSLLQWQRAESTRLTIRGNNGDHDIAVTPIRQGFHRALHHATESSKRIIECGDRRVGYLHLWSGTHDAFLVSLRDAIADAQAASLDGFVLDLRDGFGGAWRDYLDPFFPDRSDYFVAVHHRRDGASEPDRAPPRVNRNPWSGPLAVIINGGTRSGKESLAFQFKKTGRAELIGTTTAGAFTGGLGAFTEYDAGFILYLSTQETRLDGTVIEGAGVSPDIEVSDQYDYNAPVLAALDRLDCRLSR